MHGWFLPRRPGGLRARAGGPGGGRAAAREGTGAGGCGGRNRRVRLGGRSPYSTDGYARQGAARNAVGVRAASRPGRERSHFRGVVESASRCPQSRRYSTPSRHRVLRGPETSKRFDDGRKPVSAGATVPPPRLPPSTVRRQRRSASRTRATEWPPLAGTGRGAMPGSPPHGRAGGDFDARTPARTRPAAGAAKAAGAARLVTATARGAGAGAPGARGRRPGRGLPSRPVAGCPPGGRLPARWPAARPAPRHRPTRDSPAATGCR